MSLKNIDIKTVSLKDLRQFAASFAGSKDFDRIVPITVTRASAQTHNPYSFPEDIVLFAAFKNDRIIGYLGRFPGLLSFENKYYRIFWGSTFYIMDKYRGMGLGKVLLNTMISLNQDFAVTRITPQAEIVLKNYGMKVLGQLEYFQLRVEKIHFFKGLFDAVKKIGKTLGGKNQPTGNMVKKFEEIFYKLEKRFFYMAISGTIHKMKSNYNFRIAEKIKKSDFPEKLGHITPAFYRGPELINWMIEKRWVLSRCDNPTEKSGYYFSSIRDIFTYIPLKLYHKDLESYRGFIILNLSSYKGNTVLKVLDHSLKTKDVIPAACAAVLYYARQYQADRVELSLKMGDYLSEFMLFKRFLKKQKRKYFYFPANKNSPLERAKKDIRFDYCDGDTAFT